MEKVVTELELLTIETKKHHLEIDTGEAIILIHYDKVDHMIFTTKKNNNSDLWGFELCLAHRRLVFVMPVKKKNLEALKLDIEEIFLTTNYQSLPGNIYKFKRVTLYDWI